MLSNYQTDKNNIESGMFLPEDLRYYTDDIHYVHKHGIIAQALEASKILAR